MPRAAPSARPRGERGSNTEHATKRATDQATDQWIRGLFCTEVPRTTRADEIHPQHVVAQHSTSSPSPPSPPTSMTRHVMGHDLVYVSSRDERRCVHLAPRTCARKSDTKREHSQFTVITIPLQQQLAPCERAGGVFRHRQIQTLVVFLERPREESRNAKKISSSRNMSSKQNRSSSKSPERWLLFNCRQQRRDCNERHRNELEVFSSCLLCARRALGEIYGIFKGAYAKSAPMMSIVCLAH